MRARWLVAPILVTICAAYANHFHNSFHFDDFHSIVNNPSIRSVGNVPEFFVDARTFSVLPANRAWRPLTSTSLALDYWIGRGMNPVAFHVSTFLWFLLLVWILFLFAGRIFDSAHPGTDNSPVAAFAAAWFGLHPACAETINYVIQRGELYATLGVVAGIYLYAARPAWRKYGVYLLPVVAGQLSKPPAMVFPVLLFAYLLLIENATPRSAMAGATPSLLVSVAMAGLQAHMTPASFKLGLVSPFPYLITQPFVAMRYLGSFFLPLRLSADSDLSPFTSPLDPLALAGFAFLAAAVGVAVFCCRRAGTRPVGFGLWWFLAALAPTSLFPLAEVENDHRMFFPFVGLAIGAAWAVNLAWPHPRSRTLRTAGAILVLAIYAWGTRERNEVWRSEGTLWRDVTIKSPLNGRGLMNYGLSLLSAGDASGALTYYLRARQYTPNYSVLEINLGIVYGELHNNLEAERYFRRAVALAPEESLPYQFYARWLDGRNRKDEALANARKAVALNPSNPDGEALLRRMEADQASPERVLPPAPAAANYLVLSQQYHQARRYLDCIRAAREALALDPGLAEAYNNIAAAYEELGRWDEAIEAATEALRLKPEFPLARNNLAWSLTRKHLAGATAAH